MEQSRDAAKATEVIAARAADLETEVARLHHDMVSEMTAAEEARADAAELRKVFGEKESRVESLENELTGGRKSWETEKEIKKCMTREITCEIKSFYILKFRLNTQNRESNR